MTPIIATADLSKSWVNGTSVLDGIDLKIAEAERIALVGANGAGKSTLLRLLVGLTAPDRGTIKALGETLDHKSGRSCKQRLCRQIGFVFQHHGLVRRLSAHSNVVQGMLGLPGSWRAILQSTAPEEWRSRAMDSLKAVRLEDRAETRADQLSGGQAQRVAIARALVRRPRILIADEPAASLDPAAGKEVMALFSDLARRQGITLIYTTHDMAHALDYSDRVIALKGRRILFDRKSAELSTSDLGGVFHA